MSAEIARTYACFCSRSNSRGGHFRPGLARPEAVRRGGASGAAGIPLAALIVGDSQRIGAPGEWLERVTQAESGGPRTRTGADHQPCRSHGADADHVRDLGGTARRRRSPARPARCARQHSRGRGAPARDVDRFGYPGSSPPTTPDPGAMRATSRAADRFPRDANLPEDRHGSR